MHMVIDGWEVDARTVHIRLSTVGDLSSTDIPPTSSPCSKISLQRSAVGGCIATL